MDLHSFPDVQDSPLFRARCAEMEAATDLLRHKTKKLVAGGARYSESLEEAFQESLRFADCIEEFCSGTEDPDNMEHNFNVGGPTIARFVQTVRELSSFIELLRTQVELIICDRLNQRSTLMASEVRDARKRLNQRSSDYDAARSKHLGHRTLVQRGPWANNAKSSGGGGSGSTNNNNLVLGGPSPERGHQAMNAARSAADEARFDLARKLVEVQVQSRYEFLDSIASVMQAHLKYFEHGHNVVETLGPYIDETLQLSSRLKADAKSKQDALEEMITLQREADLAREAAVMAAGGGGEPSPTYRLGSSSFSDQANGPLQMNLETSALASELESYIRATHESGGSQVTVLRQGWLLKQSSNFKSKWQRRFFVLDSTGTLYYYSNKTERNSLGGGAKESTIHQQRPHHTVNLLTATVKPGAAPPKDGAPAVPFAFRVVSPEREYTLQAEDEFEMKEWMDSLQSVIACLLSGVIELDLLSNKEITLPPARATHTRAISIDLVGIGTTGRPGSATVTSPADALASTSAGEGKQNQNLSSLTTTPAPTTQAIIASVPGNNQCADCGAAGPDWGSLNLGTLHCIECSGFHRKLGVHVSKMRSLTLDVRVWDSSVVNLFQKIGNTTANAVWEGASGAAIAIASAAASPVSTPLSAAAEPRSRPTHFNDLIDDDGDEEDWVWGADGADDDGGNEKISKEEKALTAAMKKLQTAAAAAAGGGGGTGKKNNSAAGASSLSAGLLNPSKPSPSSSSAAKESFIIAKYVKKAYLSEQPNNFNANQALWAAVRSGDAVATYQALVYGADVNSLYITFSEAAHLVENTHTLAGGALERVISPRGLGEVTITHLAASIGNAVVLELLLQWGAPTELKDGYNRTPVMYSVLHDYPDVAKQLLKRGVVSSGQDVMGNTVVQMMGRKGLADAELVAALH